VSSAITTAIAVDPPLVQDANYKLDALDRQYIDDQARGAQEHLVSCLIRGVTATWVKLSGSSADGAIGEAVCLTGSTSVSEPTVTRAVAAAMADAGGVFGVLIRPASAGAYALVATGGLLPPSTSGVGVTAMFGDDRFVILDATAGLARTDAPADTDYVVGTCDAAGWLTLGVQSNVGGGGGGAAPDTEVTLTTTVAQTSFDMAGAKHLYVNAGGTATIQGILPPGANDPHTITIYGTALVILETESASAGAANQRIATSGFTDPAYQGFTLTYSTNRSRWCLVSAV
jgi:hypothetical protein